MNIRTVLSQDVELSNLWRKARSVPELPADSLPSTGAVCEHDGRTLAMAWLYLSNSKLAYVAWPVTLPGLSPRLAKEALTLVLTQLIGMAKSLGFTFIITTAESKGLIRLFKQLGMLETGQAHAILTMKAG